MSRRRIMKRRRTVTVLVLVIMSFMVSFAFANQEHEETIKIIVNSGETLWEIAGDNNPNKEDLRKLVHEIMELNNLKSGTIYAGQELLVPVNGLTEY